MIYPLPLYTFSLSLKVRFTIHKMFYKKVGLRAKDLAEVAEDVVGDGV